MTEVTIEYCVPCGLREFGTDLQEQLLDEYGRDLDGVCLVPGHGGVFTVHADGDLVWDKDDHDGAIDADAITETVGQRL